MSSRGRAWGRLCSAWLCDKVWNVSERIAREKGWKPWRTLTMSLFALGVTGNTVGAFTFLRRELEDIYVVVITTKIVGLPRPKGTPRRRRRFRPWQAFDVRILDEGGVTVAGVSIGMDDYVLVRAFEVVRDGGADRVARCPANMPDEQVAALIAIASLGKRINICMDVSAMSSPQSRSHFFLYDQALSRKRPSSRGPPFGVVFARCASPCSSLPTLRGSA